MKRLFPPLSALVAVIEPLEPKWLQAMILASGLGGGVFVVSLAGVVSYDGFYIMCMLCFI